MKRKLKSKVKALQLTVTQTDVSVCRYQLLQKANQRAENTMTRYKGCFPLRVSTCLFIFTLCGRITGALNEPMKVTVMEGNDVILPCSLSTKEDIESNLFDWKKDGQKVFYYNVGLHCNNGHSDQQDRQFKGRVFHFQDELQHGNASIIIRDTTVADSGNYTCVFPGLQPRQTFHIELVVERVKVVVMEEDDVILPCSLSTKENIESKLFDWKKDGQKEVFLFNSGDQYNNNPLDGQDRQFKGRVFHFQDELKHGNASIIIRNTKVTDSGNYTCIFPHLQPSQTFHIKLVVVGAAPEPYITIIDETNDWSLLQCAVRGAFAEPKVEWKDSSGNIVPAEYPQVTKRGDKYDVILNATVTKTDHYRCVATQKEILHQIDSKIFVRFGEKSGQGRPTGWIVPAVLGFLLLNVVLVLVLLRKRCFKKGRRRHENGSGNPPVSHHENGVCLRTEPLLPGSDVPAQQTSPV